MKIVLSPIFLFLSSSVFAQFPLQQEWLQKWDNARDYTLECIDLMPEEDLNFQPTEDVMTFTEQMVHLSKNMAWLANSYVKKTPAMDFTGSDEIADKAELRALVTQAYQYAREAVEAVKPEDLETVHDFFAGPMTTRQIMHLMQDHQTHHRGQAIIYLRLKNIKPPRYRGW